MPDAKEQCLSTRDAPSSACSRESSLESVSLSGHRSCARFGERIVERHLLEGDGIFREFQVSLPAALDSKVKDILIAAFRSAVEFCEEHAVPAYTLGFEVSESDSFGMATPSDSGIRVSWARAKSVLETLAKVSDQESVISIQTFLKGEFVHEMMHWNRGEGDGLSLAQAAKNELASHVGQFLAGVGDDHTFNEQLACAIARAPFSGDIYDKAQDGACRLIYRTLCAVAEGGFYDPPSDYHPESIKAAFGGLDGRPDIKKAVIAGLLNNTISRSSDELERLCKELDYARPIMRTTQEITDGMSVGLAGEMDLAGRVLAAGQYTVITGTSGLKLSSDTYHMEYDLPLLIGTKIKIPLLKGDYGLEEQAYRPGRYLVSYLVGDLNGRKSPVIYPLDVDGGICGAPVSFIPESVKFSLA